MLHVIPAKYHRQFNNKLIAKVNIKEEALQQTYQSKPGMMSGRTIKGYTSDVIVEGKKMMSLLPEAVKSNILHPPSNGEYSYCSGNHEQDFIDFLLLRMFYWDRYHGIMRSGVLVDVDTTDDLVESSDPENRTVEEIDATPSVMGDCEVATVSAEHITAGKIDQLCAEFDVEEIDGVKDSNEFSTDPPAPPMSYCPIGFIFFMLRGPLADRESRIDIFALHNLLENGKGSRNDSRKK